MNNYRIRYIKDLRGVRVVQADSINGFNPECDSYVFKREGEIVAVAPKARVVSIEKVGSSEDVE